MEVPRLTIGLLATACKEKYREQIRACRDTWVKKAEEIGVSVYMFGGYKTFDEYPLVNLKGVDEDFDSSFHKQFLGLKYLYEHCLSDFYLFGGTDNYFAVDRILSYLKDFDPRQKLYMGGHGEIRMFGGNNPVYFHFGGGGFILSRALARQLYEKGIFSYETQKDFIKILKSAPWCSGNPSYGLACDVAIAYYIQNLNEDYKKITVKDERFKACSCYGTTYNDLSQCCDRNVSISQWDTLLSCHYMHPSLIKQYHAYVHPDSFPKQDSFEDWTLVTSFSFCHLSDLIMGLDVNFVIYCPSEFADFFLKERSKYGLSQKTKVIEFPCRNMFQDALEQDYFNTGSKSYFGWIDENIADANGSNKHEIYRALSQRREKCSFCCVDANFLLKSERGANCDFLTGERNHLRQLFRDKMLHLSSIPSIYPLYPDLFEVYYGDRHLLLSNYDYIRREPLKILKNVIVKSRRNRNHRLGLDASWKLWNSIKSGCCSLDPPDLLRLVDEIVISAFYLREWNKPKKVFRDLRKWWGDDPERFQKAFLSVSAHMLSNTDFYWPEISKNKQVVEIYCSDPTNDNVQDTLDEYISQSDVLVILYVSDFICTLDSFCFFDPTIRPQDGVRLPVPESKRKRISF